MIEAIHSGRIDEERGAGDRPRELEAQGVDVSLLVEQLRLSPTARIESMLRLREVCAALVEAGKSSGSRQRPGESWRG